jgi:hypothetical protein
VRLQTASHASRAGSSGRRCRWQLALAGSKAVAGVAAAVLGGCM